MHFCNISHGHTALSIVSQIYDCHIICQNELAAFRSADFGKQLVLLCINDLCCPMSAGERAVEALSEMDEQIIPWFQAAAAELLQDMPAEKALALALAKITGNTELKVCSAKSLCLDAEFAQRFAKLNPI